MGDGRGGSGEVHEGMEEYCLGVYLGTRIRPQTGGNRSVHERARVYMGV